MNPGFGVGKYECENQKWRKLLNFIQTPGFGLPTSLLQPYLYNYSFGSYRK